MPRRTDIAAVRMAGQEISWHKHPTAGEHAALDGCDAGWWGTRSGRARWVVFHPDSWRPVRRGTADSPAEAKQQAETALREVASEPCPDS